MLGSHRPKRKRRPEVPIGTPKCAKIPVWSHAIPVYSLLELGCKAIYEVWRQTAHGKKDVYFIRINGVAEYNEMMQVVMKDDWSAEYLYIYDYPGDYYDYDGEMAERVKMMIDEMKANENEFENT